MRKKAVLALIVLLLLAGKFFLSACPMLPDGYFGQTLYLDDLNWNQVEIEDGWTKALIWLECYLAVPRIELPADLPRTIIGMAGLGFAESENGSIWCVSYDTGDIISFRQEDGTYKQYVCFYGMGSSLRYLFKDRWTAEIMPDARGD